MKESPLLSTNDMAAALNAVSHAISFVNKLPGGKFKKSELAKFRALASKLNDACDHLNPYVGDTDSMPLGWGDAPIYGPMTKRQQERTTNDR